MLVLTRQRNESIMIDKEIVVTVSDVRGDKVRLAIAAPRHIKVYRKEIYDQIVQENQSATQMNVQDVPAAPASAPPPQPHLRIATSAPRLGRAMLFVTDLPQARDFYRDTLGLDLAHDAPDHLVFDSGGWTLLIFPCHQTRPLPDHAAIPSTVLLFEVPSIDEAMADLQRKNVHFLHAQPNQNALGRYAAFADPFNNIHELFEPKTA